MMKIPLKNGDLIVMKRWPGHTLDIRALGVQAVDGPCSDVGVVAGKEDDWLLCWLSHSGFVAERLDLYKCAMYAVVRVDYEALCLKSRAAAARNLVARRAMKTVALHLGVKQLQLTKVTAARLFWSALLAKRASRYKRNVGAELCGYMHRPGDTMRRLLTAEAQETHPFVQRGMLTPTGIYQLARAHDNMKVILARG